jgi:RNase H-like domain found in reverse transcriptase
MDRILSEDCLIHAMKNELMDIIFQNDLQPYVFDYLDDIIIIRTSFQHQIDLIKEVAKRLREANLTVNLNKVHANLSRIKILGNILDKDGLHADPVKVKAMSKYPVPRNAKDVKRFLGVSGWFSRFIQNYSAIVPPLSKLLKKNVKFIWGPEEQDAFEKIKCILSKDPVIRPPDWKKPFVVQTDASHVGIAGVLLQSEGDTKKDEYVVAYFSRKLSDREQRFTPMEKEGLAVLESLKRFRPFIEQHETVVYTDHYNLIYLINMKEKCPRVARWVIKLMPYLPIIKHKAGRELVVPDALSRAPEEEAEIPTISILEALSPDDRYDRQVESVRRDNPDKYQINDENELMFKTNPLDKSEDPWKVIPRPA